MEGGDGKAGFPCMEGGALPKVICVLLVGYDKDARHAFASRLRVLKIAELVTQEAESAALATNMIEAGFRPHAIFCDLEMPGNAGRLFFRWVCDQYPDLAKGFCFLAEKDVGVEEGRCLERGVNDDRLREMLIVFLSR